MYEGQHRISYYDLDLMGRVKLSAILRMVHIAADVNAKDLGIGFSQLSAHNMTFILQRFALGIERMPEYDEVVTIRTWPDSVARGAFWRKGDMFDAEGKKIMEWASMWILFDIAERKIIKPSALPIALPAVEDHGVKIMPEKIALPDGAPGFGNSHTVCYADVDTNIHMNNAIYGDLIGNAMFPTIARAENSPPWREVQINYLAETKLGEHITLETHHSGNTFTVIGKTLTRTSFTARISV
jgi:acyl-ACP thioesterase